MDEKSSADPRIRAASAHRRAQWVVRAFLASALAASALANAASAQPTRASVALHVWPVAALFIAIELVARYRAESRGRRFMRDAATVVIGACAAWISYWHAVDAARVLGEVGASMYLWPLAADGLAAVCMLTLFELADRVRANVAQTADEKSSAEIAALRAALETADAQTAQARADAERDRAALARMSEIVDARTAERDAEARRAAHFELELTAERDRAARARKEARTADDKSSADARMRRGPRTSAARTADARSAVRAAFAAGVLLTDALTALPADARPAPRTAQEWVQDLRGEHAEARARKRAADRERGA